MSLRNPIFFCDYSRGPGPPPPSGSPHFNWPSSAVSWLLKTKIVNRTVMVPIHITTPNIHFTWCYIKIKKDKLFAGGVKITIDYAIASPSIRSKDQHSNL